ncbi:hypothetical protein GQX74_015143 [Glossina fuscipes]|nr:hypothetical protein GQX74_015143 [Glossina fuscipes]
MEWNNPPAPQAILLALLESLHGWFTTYADMDVRADTHFYGITTSFAWFWQWRSAFHEYLPCRKAKASETLLEVAKICLIYWLNCLIPFTRLVLQLKMFIWSNLAKRKDKVNLPYYMAFVKSQRYDMLLNMHICSLEKEKEKNRRMRRSTGINKTAATCSYNTKKTTLKTFVNGRKAFDLNTLPISL